ncbi:MAG: patatin-like phospholipase family protein [Proteobacteria bacterium]|nr:patatin-like phospholipase family protein [Pseudomonadota bacterium]
MGLALGSGAARGWSHIGVIRELESMGIKPDLVAGSSVGAVVGAAYAAGKLDAFADWVMKLDRMGVIRLLAGRTIVMKYGRVIESGLTDQILEDPQHAYTQRLVSSAL